jgi:spermidine synthase
MTMDFRKTFFLTLFFMSGFCNLTYEIVWVRMLNLVFGVTVFAVSAVTASFMMGMALGAIGFGGIIDKSKNRFLLFSLCHVGIGAAAIAIILGFPWFQGFYLSVNHLFHPDFYAMRVLLFFLSLVLLVIPTTLMGATFPVATRILTANEEGLGSNIGVLYGANTLGSVLGCSVTVFFILGPAGMKGTIYVAAIADCAIGLAVLALANTSLRGRTSR